MVLLFIWSLTLQDAAICGLGVEIHIININNVFFLHQGPCYINFDRFPLDQTKADEEFSGWDRDF